MTEPLELTRYVALTVEELAPEDVKYWYQFVSGHVPSGLVMAVQTNDDNGLLRSVSMIHRTAGQDHVYLVPLTRHLTPAEAEALATDFAEENPEVDFDIDCSTAEAEEPPVVETEVSVDDAAYLALCTAWAKRQHDCWLKERTETGWRYGATFSTKEKTHPLLRPWEQLPDRFRKVDYSQPQMLLDLLNDQGYAVVSRGEVEALLTLMRGAA